MTKVPLIPRICPCIECKPKCTLIIELTSSSAFCTFCTKGLHQQ